MTSSNLENLANTSSLKRELPSIEEFSGLVRSAKARLQDAHNASLSADSRFDLSYNAAHALALAALRWQGYRSENRYLVFQCLPHTLNAQPEVWRVLAKCHHQRNLAEYEGHLEIDNTLLNDLLLATDWLLTELSKLPAIK